MYKKMLIYCEKLFYYTSIYIYLCRYLTKQTINISHTCPKTSKWHSTFNCFKKKYEYIYIILC